VTSPFILIVTLIARGLTAGLGGTLADDDDEVMGRDALACNVGMTADVLVVRRFGGGGGGGIPVPSDRN
jgi:hypothetical protein